MTSLPKFELLLHIVIRESKLNLSKTETSPTSDQDYAVIRQLRWIWELNKSQIDDLFDRVDRCMSYDLGFFIYAIDSILYIIKGQGDYRLLNELKFLYKNNVYHNNGFHKHLVEPDENAYFARKFRPILEKVMQTALNQDVPARCKE